MTSDPNKVAEAQALRAHMRLLEEMMQHATGMPALQRVFAGAGNIGADIPLPIYDKKNFAELDAYVRDYDYANVPPVMAMATLRYTFSVKDYLDHWIPAVRTVKALFAAQGQDAKIMVGFENY